MPINSYRVRIQVTNDDTEAIKVWIEPWAEEIQLQGGAELEIQFDGPDQEIVNVCHIKGGIVVHGFRGSLATAWQEGHMIWAAHERLAL